MCIYMYIYIYIYICVYTISQIQDVVVSLKICVLDVDDVWVSIELFKVYVEVRFGTNMFTFLLLAWCLMFQCIIVYSLHLDTPFLDWSIVFHFFVQWVVMIAGDE